MHAMQTVFCCVSNRVCRDLVPADRSVVEKLNAVWERAQSFENDKNDDNGAEGGNSDNEEGSTETLFEVEDVVGQRQQGAELEYLVVWAKEKEPSWTPRYLLV